MKKIFALLLVVCLVLSLVGCAADDTSSESGGEGVVSGDISDLKLADIELKDKANNEMDEVKYAAIQAQIAQALKDSLVPFEEAYNVSTSNDLKVSIADYLMRIYYRMGDVENYKKYTEVVKSGQAN